MQNIKYRKNMLKDQRNVRHSLITLCVRLKDTFSQGEAHIYDTLFFLWTDHFFSDSTLKVMFRMRSRLRLKFTKCQILRNQIFCAVS